MQRRLPPAVYVELAGEVEHRGAAQVGGGVEGGTGARQRVNDHTLAERVGGHTHFLEKGKRGVTILDTRRCGRFFFSLFTF